MAFIDRIVEFPNRYYLEDTDGVQTGPYTLVRAEGTVDEEGTLLNAEGLTSNIIEIIKSQLEVVHGSTTRATVSANTFYTETITLTAPTGKTLIGVAGFRVVSPTGGNGSHAKVQSAYVSGANTITVTYTNDGTGGTNWTTHVYGLYV